MIELPRETDQAAGPVSPGATMMGPAAGAMKQSFGAGADPFGSIRNSFEHCESATHMPHNRNRYRRVARRHAMLCPQTYSKVEFPIARVPDGRGARCARASPVTLLSARRGAHRFFEPALRNLRHGQ